ncbi:MAG: hypothetical protein JNM14_09000 [Ferruginibacter sp.]|nr:hypothetical protein [Ferruginibacter sp.]
MQPDNFSPKDSLQLIDSMINQAKNRFSENGFLYLLWGWLILICSVGHFIFIKLDLFRHPEIIWASTWLAVIFQVFYLLRKRKKDTVRTYSENIVGYVWMVFGVSMGMISFILSKTNSWEAMYPLLLMMYGMPTFLSGVIMRFLPLRVGGIICWCLSLVSVVVTSIYILLLLGAAVIAAWIVPGYLLRKKYNQQNG